jgi:hypothetical protein
MKEDNGAFASEPGSREPSHHSTGSRPIGFDPSRVWRYARSQKKSLSALLPEDFFMTIQGDISDPGIHVSGTVQTTLQCDALVTALLHFRGFLTSHREAVAGDFYDEPPAPPSFADEINAFLGCDSDAPPPSL